MPTSSPARQPPETTPGRRQRAPILMLTRKGHFLRHRTPPQQSNPPRRRLSLRRHSLMFLAASQRPSAAAPCRGVDPRPGRAGGHQVHSGHAPPPPPTPQPATRGGAPRTPWRTRPLRLCHLSPHCHSGGSTAGQARKRPSPLARPSWPPCGHRRGACRGGYGRLNSTRPTFPPLDLYTYASGR